jgi:hypothetical protein
MNLSRILRDGVERELRGEAPSAGGRARAVGSSIDVRVTVPVKALLKEIRLVNAKAKRPDAGDDRVVYGFPNGLRSECPDHGNIEQPTLPAPQAAVPVRASDPQEAEAPDGDDPEDEDSPPHR